MITPSRGRARIDAGALDQLLHPTIDPMPSGTIVATGLPASPGAAAGEIVFDADEAEAMKAQGRDVILVRIETSPEDIHGMHAAAGILTTRGGMTSHAAVVARGMGRPCVCGAGDACASTAKAGTMTVGAARFHKGDIITIDGATGEVLQGPRRDAPAGAVGRLRQDHGLGRRRPAASASAPTPTRRAMRARPASSAPRASGCAAPSTCSSTPTASWPCAR